MGGFNLQKNITSKRYGGVSISFSDSLSDSDLEGIFYKDDDNNNM